MWIKDFVQGRGVPAASQGETATLTADRMTEVCRDPSSISAEDLDGIGVLVLEPTALSLTDPSKHRGHAWAVLGHELGHAMLLGHGNGVDDDGDSVWDQCDADESADATPISLMNQEPSNPKPLTPLQIEWARKIAPRYRGAIVP